MTWYLAFSLRFFNNIVVARTNIVSIPTIPKAEVNITSRKLLANDENRKTHPSRAAATTGLGQTLSATNGGEVLFKYPQQLNYN